VFYACKVSIMKATSMDRTSKPRPALRLVNTKGLPREDRL